MRVTVFALAAALLMAGCSSVPMQPAQPDQAFQTKFLNLASITDQIGNQVNVVPNTQVNVPIQIAPITQVSALSWGNQSAMPNLTGVTNQGINPNIQQMMDQFAASI